jgi:hypothetical protein
VFTYGLTGFRWRADRVHLDPMLPPQLAGGVTLRGLHWHGRTFDVAIGATTTTVTLRAGSAFTLETAAGTTTVGSGSPASVPTRRPDLAPTDDIARCRTATATSEEAGMYAEAAVDGSKATIWAPADTTASLTVDLGSRRHVSGVAVQWTDTLPTSSSIDVSTDGTTWSPPPPADATGTPRNPVWARYVRVTMTRDPAASRTGIREVSVTASK